MLCTVFFQCFVTLGVSLNMAGTGLVIGFGAPLLVQLKASDSVILIDESSGSWIGMNIHTEVPTTAEHA